MQHTTQQVRSQGFVVVECDIPSGMTLAEYRAERVRMPQRRWRLLPLPKRIR